MIIKEITTNLNSIEIYTKFKDKKYSFILDSGMDPNKLGKYSIIGFDPFLIFKSKNNLIQIIQDNNIETYTGNPFDKLKELLKKYELNYNV